MSTEASEPSVVLVHGLWLTPRSWEGWVTRFEGRGRQVLAPAWPRIEGDVEDIRRDPSPLNGLGVTEIVEHYAEVIRGLDRPPIIIGHSFGGLVTELLLDRGLGVAGVALSPAPVKGVLRLPLAQLRASLPVLKNPANRNRTVELTPQQFHYAFTNTMSDADAKGGLRPLRDSRPRQATVRGRIRQPQSERADQGRLPQRPPPAPVGDRQRRGPHRPGLREQEAAKRLAKSGAVVEYPRVPGAAPLHRGSSRVGGSRGPRARMGNAPRRGGRVSESPIEKLLQAFDLVRHRRGDGAGRSRRPAARGGRAARGGERRGSRAADALRRRSTFDRAPDHRSMAPGRRVDRRGRG